MFIRIVGLLSAALLAGACALPIETFRATAYSEIARVQMAAGDPAGARATAQRAVAAIVATETGDERVFGIPAAAIAQVRAGDLDGAQNTIESTDKDQNRVFAYAALAMALKDSGYPEQARESASRALEAAASIENERDKDEMMVYAAWAQAATGDPAGALRNAEGLHRQKNRVGFLTLIAEAQLEGGDIAGALATVESIGEAVEKWDNDAWIFSRIVRGIAVDPFAVFESLVLESEMPLQAIIMTRIAMAQARAGDSDGARRSFLAAMQFAGTVRGARNQIRGVSNIALARATAGDLSGAIESLNYAEQLAVGQTPEDGEGRVGEGIGYALTMRSAISGNGSPDDVLGIPGGAGQETAELLVAAAMAKTQLGRTKAAAEYLEAAVDSRSSDGDLSMVAAAYGSLAGARFRQGDRAGGRAAAKRTLEIADIIASSSEDRLIGLFFASVALARTGDVVLALETADRIEDTTPKPQYLEPQNPEPQ
jgi:tetratricopeptide (TPR) repeat protein